MRYITIEGNIGVGKTTLATKLANDYNAKLLLEQFDTNSFLPKFYKNPKKYSFQLELSFLIDRYHQIKKEILKKTDYNSLIIADYSITKSAIFAEKTLHTDDFQVFRNIYDELQEKLPKPDLYVFLHAGTKQLSENIKKRGRFYETNISQNYLSKIENGYTDFINRILDFPVLFLDINNLDFKNEVENYNVLKRAIFNSDFKLGINHLD